jgi:putative ABC transport system permease protein
MSLLAVLVGGVGVLNTMLMAVFERTREIGVMRSLGWGRRRVLGMVMNEALLLGLLGGLAGIALAYVLASLLERAPMVGEYYDAQYSLALYARTMAIAVILGGLGGVYPAFRATRLQPVEALRYE